VASMGRTPTLVSPVASSLRSIKANATMEADSTAMAAGIQSQSRRPITPNDAVTEARSPTPAAARAATANAAAAALAIRLRPAPDDAVEVIVMFACPWRQRPLAAGARPGDGRRLTRRHWPAQ